MPDAAQRTQILRSLLSQDDRAGASRGLARARERDNQQCGEAYGDAKCPHEVQQFDAINQMGCSMRRKYALASSRVAYGDITGYHR